MRFAKISHTRHKEHMPHKVNHNFLLRIFTSTNAVTPLCPGQNHISLAEHNVLRLIN